MKSEDAFRSLGIIFISCAVLGLFLFEALSVRKYGNEKQQKLEGFICDFEKRDISRKAWIYPSISLAGVEAKKREIDKDSSGSWPTTANERIFWFYFL